MATRDSRGRFIPRSRALVRRSPTRITRRTRTRSVPVYRTRTVMARPRRRSRGSRGPTGGVTLGKVIVGGAALGWLTSQSSPVTAVRTFLAEKVPGGKTFGAAATGGALALAVDRWFYKSPWLRAAGIVGIGIAALKLGEQNTAFKFLGEEGCHGEDEFVADVG